MSQPSPDRIEIVLNEIPICPTCGGRCHWLNYHEVPDGVTTILTDFTWWCDACGHSVEASIPDLCVDSRRPSTDQVLVRQLSTERSPN